MSDHEVCLQVNLAAIQDEGTAVFCGPDAQRWELRAIARVLPLTIDWFHAEEALSAALNEDDSVDSPPAKAASEKLDVAHKALWDAVYDLIYNDENQGLT